MAARLSRLLVAGALILGLAASACSSPTPTLCRPLNDDQVDDLVERMTAAHASVVASDKALQELSDHAWGTRGASLRAHYEGFAHSIYSVAEDVSPLSDYVDVSVLLASTSEYRRLASDCEERLEEYQATYLTGSSLGDVGIDIVWRYAPELERRVREAELYAYDAAREVERAEALLEFGEGI